VPSATSLAMMGLDRDSAFSRLIDINPVGLLDACMAASESAMQERHFQWRRYRQKLRHLWYLNVGGSKRPAYTTNYMRDKISTVVWNMFLQFTYPQWVPPEEGDRAAAQVATSCIQHVLKEAGLFRASLKAALEGDVTGTTWLKTYYSPQDEKIHVDWVAADDVLVDPKAVEPQLARWVIHRRRDVPVDDLEEEYGVKIKGEDAGPGGTTSPSRWAYTDEQRAYTPGRVVDCLEGYFRTQTGWHVIVSAGKQLLESKPLPYEHGELPLVAYSVGLDGTDMYPPGICEMIEPLQDLADALDEQIYRNIRMTTNRQRIINTMSGIRKEHVDNVVGRIYESQIDPRFAMVWDTPPTLASDVFAYREKIEERIDRVSGIYTQTHGRTERGVTAYAAIATLQEFSTRPIQGRMKLLADTKRQVGFQVWSLIKQYYGPLWIVRLAGGPHLQVLDDYPEAIRQWTPEEKAAWREAMGVNLVLSDIDERFDLQGSTDTALPSSRMQQAQLMLQLSAMADEWGIRFVDAEAVLDALDIPDREQILARRKKRFEMIMQKAQGQEQQVPGAGLGLMGMGDVPGAPGMGGPQLMSEQTGPETLMGAIGL